MKKIYVSGHVDLTADEFGEHYAPQILEAAERGDSFVVGDARGADSMAQALLKHLGCSVVVYHMYDKPRNNVGFPTIGGFELDRARDEAMTDVTEIDIAWVRPGRENSGTAKNLKRRERQHVGESESFSKEYAAKIIACPEVEEFIEGLLREIESATLLLPPISTYSWEEDRPSRPGSAPVLSRSYTFKVQTAGAVFHGQRHVRVSPKGQIVKPENHHTLDFKRQAKWLDLGSMKTKDLIIELMKKEQLSKSVKSWVHVALKSMIQKRLRHPLEAVNVKLWGEVFQLIESQEFRREAKSSFEDLLRVQVHAALRPFTYIDPEVLHKFVDELAVTYVMES